MRNLRLREGNRDWSPQRAGSSPGTSPGAGTWGWVLRSSGCRDSGAEAYPTSQQGVQDLGLVLATGKRVEPPALLSASTPMSVPLPASDGPCGTFARWVDGPPSQAPQGTVSVWLRALHRCVPGPPPTQPSSPGHLGTVGLENSFQRVNPSSECGLLSRRSREVTSIRPVVPVLAAMFLAFLGTHTVITKTSDTREGRGRGPQGTASAELIRPRMPTAPVCSHIP